MAIARALASKPAILLADEPTGNLDSKTSEDVIALLKTTSQTFHQTIVMITHNPADRPIGRPGGAHRGRKDFGLVTKTKTRKKRGRALRPAAFLSRQIRQQGASVYAGSLCAIGRLSGKDGLLCSAGPHWAWTENFCLTAVTLACSTCWVGYQPLSAIWS